MSLKHKPATINDVARIAGVSKRTVSRVINESTKVGAATREKVQQVIRDLSFSPNSQARGLATRRSFLLGLIYDNPTLFINEIQRSILNICVDAGYELVVRPMDSKSPEVVDQVGRFVARSKIDGIIILPPVSELNELIAALDNMGCQHVSMTSHHPDEPCKLVVTDDRPAISRMTDHLVRLGHRDIAFISGPRDNVASCKRRQAFESALAEHGLSLSESEILEGQFTFESGVECATRLLQREQRPTAVFAANDEMAIGVMNVAHSLGIRVPEELSVVGFDGTPFSLHVLPHLTTIRRPVADMAELATRKLLALIDGDQEAACNMATTVLPEFVVGDSTGPARR